MPVEPEAAQQEEAPVPQKKKKLDIAPKTKRLMTLGAGIVAIMLAIASAFYVTQMIKSPKDKEGKKPSEDISKTEAIYIKLKEFTVNLKSEGQYLEAELVLQAHDEKVKQEIEKKMPEIRDNINSIMMSKTMGDLLTAEGKNQLKEEIRKQLNKDLVDGQINKVHFTSFLMQ